MSPLKPVISSLLAYSLFFCSCSNEQTSAADQARADSAEKAQTAIVDGSVVLPAPYATKSSSKRPDIVGWKDNAMPSAPEGFTVSRFADGLQHPRWIYVAPNGDVFVSQADKKNSANNILLFRDADRNGTYEKYTYAGGLNMPFGMVVAGNNFYVANTDAILQFPYDASTTALKGTGKKILSLPAGGRHWTKNIVASKGGDKLYVSVGSSSNVAEDGIDKETRRACILEINADGTGEKLYASGLRNPVGMDWAPGTQTLWAAVNERDELGDDLPPDYLVGVRENGFYGWPYAYFGNNEDPRLKGQQPELVSKSIKPDVALGAHTASLGLAFYRQTGFPQKYRDGAFIGQHGSWNRAVFSGYKVVFVPFKGGKPQGSPEDFLTGFIANENKSEVYGRPVGVAVTADGSLLVADDGGNCIWKVSYNK